MNTTPAVTTDPTPGQARRGRRRVAVIGVAAVVVLLAIALVVGQLSKPAPKPPSVGTELNSPLAADIANLPLVDEHGAATNLAAFKGKIVVLTDFMTLCQEICPITTAQLTQVDKLVTKAGLADKVQFVLITVDPQRDTADQLRAYRSFAELPSNFSLLTGTPDNLAKLWKYVGVGYQRQPQHDPPGIDWRTGKPLTYDVQHTDVLMYLDANNDQRYAIVGMPSGQQAPLTKGEEAFLNDEGRENLKSGDEAAWTANQAAQVVSWLAGKHL